MLNQREIFNRQRRKRNKVARDLNSFSALIDSPQDMGTAAAGATLTSAVVLPGTARLGVSLDAVTEQGDITVSIGGRELHIPGGAADRVFRLDVGARAKEVEVNRGIGCPAGTVTLHVLDEWQRAYPIATGEFSI